MAEYYFLAGEEVRGPFGLADCFLLIDQGTLNQATMICQAGTETWLPLRTFPELNGRKLPTAKSKQESEVISPVVVAGRTPRHAGKLVKFLAFLMIVVGLIASIGYAQQPNWEQTPAWPIVLMLVGFAAFVVARFAD